MIEKPLKGVIGNRPLSLLRGRIPGIENKMASRIVFGTVNLHTILTQDEAFQLLDVVWASGCNVFDVAAIYGGGQCEQILGDWLSSRKVPKDEVIVITKGGCEGQDKLWAATIRDRSAVLASLESSLKRLQLKHIDCYLLHRDDPSVPVEYIVDTMSSLVDSKVVGAWGVSNWSVNRICAAQKYANDAGRIPLSIDSPQFSLAKPSRPVWPGTAFIDSYKDYDSATKSDIVVLGWECLAKGFMCGKWADAGVAIEADNFELNEHNGNEWRDAQLRIAYYTEKNFARQKRAIEIAKLKGVEPAELALGYVLSQSENSFALVGTTKKKHFLESARAGDKESNVVNMTLSEIRYLENGVEPEGGLNKFCCVKVRSGYDC